MDFLLLLIISDLCLYLIILIQINKNLCLQENIRNLDHPKLSFNHNFISLSQIVLTLLNRLLNNSNYLDFFNLIELIFHYILNFVKILSIKRDNQKYEK
jgi:hypothetical protein